MKSPLKILFMAFAVISILILLLIATRTTSGEMTGEVAKQIVEEAAQKSQLLFWEDRAAQSVVSSEFLVKQEFEINDRTIGKTQCYIVSTVENIRLWFVILTKGDNTHRVYYVGQSGNDNARFFVANIDGIFGEELVVNIETPGAGKTGPYHESSIYTLVDDEMKILYRSAFFVDSIAKIDTGFRLSFLQDGSAMIKNHYTGKTNIVHMASLIDPSMLDKVLQDNKLLNSDGYISGQSSTQNNFILFKPVDVDNDEVSEIVACENFFMVGDGVWNIGKCFIALKYDSSTQMLSVVDSGFWDPESSSITLEQYADTWFINNLERSSKNGQKVKDFDGHGIINGQD